MTAEQDDYEHYLAWKDNQAVINSVTTIEQDDYDSGIFTFKFPFSNDSRNPIYLMIGRLYVDLGEDSIESYSVGLFEKDVLEVKIRIDRKDQEQQNLQEVLTYWYEANDCLGFSFCPLNFDIILTTFPTFRQEEQNDNLMLKNSVPDYFKKVDTLWGKQSQKSTPNEILIKEGQTAFYSNS